LPDRVQKYLIEVQKGLEGKSLFAGLTKKAEGILDEKYNNCKNALKNTGMSQTQQEDALDAFESYQDEIEIGKTSVQHFNTNRKSELADYFRKHCKLPE